MQRSSLLLSTAVGLTMVVAGPASALPKARPHNGSLKGTDLQHKPGAPARPARPERPPSGHPKLKETFTIDTWSNTTAALLGGFTADGSTSVNFSCKKACTVLTDAVVAIGAYYSYNSLGYCPVVDGYFTNGACFFVNLPAGSGWNNIPFKSHVSLGTGTHTAEVYLYSVAPAYIGPRQTDYHVYK
jgi:hypothetical protein